MSKTVRGPEWEDAIQELYMGGLSRKEIRVALDDKVSERYIREITEDETRENRYIHKRAQREVRIQSRGIARNSKEYGAIYSNKMVGRGMRKVRGLNLRLGEKYSTEWWDARERAGLTIEGS